MIQCYKEHISIQETMLLINFGVSIKSCKEIVPFKFGSLRRPVCPSTAAERQSTHAILDDREKGRLKSSQGIV